MLRAWARTLRQDALRLLALLAISACALQVVWLGRVATLRFADPRSTSFQRSEAWRLLHATGPWTWRQTWVEADRIAPGLKQAVIAAEDAGFTDHHGFEWAALERAWGRNQRAAERHEAARRTTPTRAGRASRSAPGALGASRHPAPNVVGGSTITQQLAKNLFFSGERTWLRKAQESAVASMLEGLLPKARIHEIYLNHVEWGEGLYGAEAGAQRYFRTGAGNLGRARAARLAVMLPAPRRFEKSAGSSQLLARAAGVEARMREVDVP